MEQNIGEFLRSRRARIQPEDVGLVSGYGRRRVPGLRREELAQLAGVSVDYYVRLEQGRSPTVSDSVLDSIGRALRLDGVEQAHLRDLVRPVGDARRAAGAQQVRPQVRRLLEMMSGVPAFILGRRLEVLAWNALADAVYGYSTQEPAYRNAGRHLFLNPAARDFYPEWETVAAETVGVLRLDAGRYPDDPLTAALVGELSMKSEPFRELWARHDVREKIHGHKLINHPIVGELEFEYESLAPPGDSDQLIVAYTVEANSPTDERMRLLASWQATEPAADLPVADPAAEAN
ncbi:MAG TPA: helix-turn-helix transcriptional regulator [Pseudonocardiaceae bacterium]|nr:helix-turn-helix transcriptional regulator [Pseudonocardiaceae bacterium]